MTRSAFIDHIFNKNWLWSYDPRAKDQVPENVIIEHALLYADVEELQQLFTLFDNQVIESVWREKLLFQARYKKLNTYLAKFFFNISNAEEFVNQHLIEYPRLERFRLLASED